VQMPEGESLQEVQSRVAQCIKEIVEENPEGQVLIVAHGFALLSFVCHVLNLPLDHFRQLHLDHLGLTQIEVLPERMVLRRFNAHLSESALPIHKLLA
jgi:broad specificity phosphatase PhoE